MLLFLLAVSGAALAHRYLQVYAPSNVVVAHARRARPRLRVAAGLFALSTALAASAFALTEWVVNGGPGSMNLVIIIATWDAFKFTFTAITVALCRAPSTRRKRSLSRPDDDASRVNAHIDLAGRL
ncbi:hypothetical protein [Nocardioides caldifontis]|uniref:hypothetical protein n=1 Tax=Nocardioides caldifontis TaxID=2588938 RepID=UPI0011DF77AE|nr:hypothetical protein [Nocardioides caldifontis]